jgi:hypothetical protein
MCQNHHSPDHDDVLVALQPAVALRNTPSQQKDHMLQQGMPRYTKYDRCNLIKPRTEDRMKRASAYHLQCAGMLFEDSGLVLQPWTQLAVETGEMGREGQYGLLDICGFKTATFVKGARGEVEVDWEALDMVDVDVDWMKTFEVHGMLRWFEALNGDGYLARHTVPLEVLAEVQPYDPKDPAVCYLPLLICQVLLTKPADKALIPLETVKVADVPYVRASRELQERYMACLSSFVAVLDGECTTG